MASQPPPTSGGSPPTNLDLTHALQALTSEINALNAHFYGGANPVAAAGGSAGGSQQPMLGVGGGGAGGQQLGVLGTLGTRLSDLDQSIGKLQSSVNALTAVMSRGQNQAQGAAAGPPAMGATSARGAATGAVPPSAAQGAAAGATPAVQSSQIAQQWNAAMHQVLGKMDSLITQLHPKAGGVGGVVGSAMNIGSPQHLNVHSPTWKPSMGGLVTALGTMRGLPNFPAPGGGTGNAVNPTGAASAASVLAPAAAAAAPGGVGPGTALQAGVAAAFPEAAVPMQVAKQAFGVINKVTGIGDAAKTIYAATPGPQHAAADYAQAYASIGQQAPWMTTFGRRQGYTGNTTFHRGYEKLREQANQVGLNTEDFLATGTYIQNNQTMFGSKGQVNAQLNQEILGAGGTARAMGITPDQSAALRTQQAMMGLNPNETMGNIMVGTQQANAVGSQFQFAQSTNAYLQQLQANSLTGAQRGQADVLGFETSLYGTNTPAAIAGTQKVAADLTAQAAQPGSKMGQMAIGYYMSKKGGGMSYDAALKKSQAMTPQDQRTVMQGILGPAALTPGSTTVAAVGQYFGISNQEGFENMLDVSAGANLDDQSMARMQELTRQYGGPAQIGAGSQTLAAIATGGAPGRSALYDYLKEQSPDYLKQQGVKGPSDIKDPYKMFQDYATAEQKRTGKPYTINAQALSDAENYQNAAAQLQNTQQKTAYDYLGIQTKGLNAEDWTTEKAGGFAEDVGTKVSQGFDIFTKGLTEAVPAIGDFTKALQDFAHGNISAIPGDVVSHTPLGWLGGKLSGHAAGGNLPPGANLVGEGGPEILLGAQGTVMSSAASINATGQQYASETTQEKVLTTLQLIESTLLSQTTSGQTQNDINRQLYGNQSPAALAIAGGAAGGVYDSGARAGGGPPAGGTAGTGTPGGGYGPGSGAAPDIPTAGTSGGGPGGGTATWNKFQDLSYGDYQSIVQSGSMGGKTSPLLGQKNYDAMIAVAKQNNLDPRVMLSFLWSEGHMGTDPGLAAARVNNLGGEKFVGQPGATDSGISADTGGTYAAYNDLTQSFSGLATNLTKGPEAPYYRSGDLSGLAGVYTNGPGTGQNKVTQYNQYAATYPNGITPGGASAASTVAGGNAAGVTTKELGTAGGVPGSTVAETATKFLGQVVDQFKVDPNIKGGNWTSWCLSFVADTLEQSGVKSGLRGVGNATAAQSYNRIAQAGGFSTDQGPPPAGAVVLMPGTAGNAAGHALISTGNGQLIATTDVWGSGIHTDQWSNVQAAGGRWYVPAGVSTTGKAGTTTGGGTARTDTGTAAPDTRSDWQRISDTVQANNQQIDDLNKQLADPTIKGTSKEQALRNKRDTLMNDNKALTKNAEAITNQDAQNAAQARRDAGAGSNVPDAKAGVASADMVGIFTEKRDSLLKQVMSGKDEKGNPLAPGAYGAITAQLNEANAQLPVWNQLTMQDAITKANGEPTSSAYASSRQNDIWNRPGLTEPTTSDYQYSGGPTNDIIPPAIRKQMNDMIANGDPSGAAALYGRYATDVNHGSFLSDLQRNAPGRTGIAGPQGASFMAIDDPRHPPQDLSGNAWDTTQGSIVAPTSSTSGALTDMWDTGGAAGIYNPSLQIGPAVTPDRWADRNAPYATVPNGIYPPSNPPPLLDPITNQVVGQSTYQNIGGRAENSYMTKDYPFLGQDVLKDLIAFPNGRPNDLNPFGLTPDQQRFEAALRTALKDAGVSDLPTILNNILDQTKQNNAVSLKDSSGNGGVLNPGGVPYIPPPVGSNNPTTLWGNGARTQSAYTVGPGGTTTVTGPPQITYAPTQFSDVGDSSGNSYAPVPGKPGQPY